MSNLENNTNDLNINTTIDGNAATGTAELSAELVNLTKQLQQLSQAAVKQANVTQSWNQAMGMSKAGVSQYSQQLNSSINVITKLSNATRIYKDVLNEAKKSTEGFAQAQSLISSNKGGLDASFVQRYNAGLVQGQNHLSSMTSGSKDLEKAMKRVALIDISRNISRGAQAESNAAYAFTRNFSTPIIGALRESFFSYSKLATESVRTTKLIMDNFSNLADASDNNAKQMAEAQKFTAKLGKELDKVTQSWGTSRVLVQALAGDFAELGISSQYLLADMTKLTVEAEKLGNLDIAQSSSFLTSMYQTILRIRRETGKSVDINEPTGAVSKDIMEQLTGQLAMFNLIENKTVMSLRNISDAFPEVTAAATSFGLSMSEATALIIPMIGAGFQVGASANSLKVSLQRMVAMTKQNTTILNELNKSLGNGFELSAGVGMDQIQKLSDAYGYLVRDVEKGGKGKQGALELFSRLFGVRQGPRMESAVAQLNAFQIQIDTIGSAEQKISKQLQDSVNAELKAIGQKEINIKQYKDLSTLHRQAIATDEKGNLTAQAAAIQKGQIAAQGILEKAGGKQADFISNMSTEVGKALMAQAFDTASLAGRQYDLELQLSQNTPEVRYRRAKESMLALGRAIVPVVDSILKVLLPAFQKLSSFLQNNPAIAKLTGAFLLLAAAVGPIRLAFATMKTVFGGAITLFVKLTEKITGVSYAFASLQDLMSNPDLLRGQDKVVQYLDNFLIKTRRNGKALRKEMDLTGLSQPVQEMFKNNKAAAIYGTDKAVNMKRLSPIVPDTSQFLNDMKTLNIENNTRMGAEVAKSSEKGIVKGAEGFSDKFAEAAAKAIHRFQGPNLFAGPNYFEGNVPGIGDSGGPRVGKGGGGGGGGGGKAAARIAAEQATVTAATQSTFQKNIKRQINDFFLNPLGIGNIAAGGPTPGKTDGLNSSIHKLLNAMKGQSSSSPPRQLAELTTGRPGGALELFRQVVKSPYYHTPGMTDIGRSGTSGVLLSTLQKIEAALPKSMSGRIVRDRSQSYGFPLTGQGRIPYSSPSIQQILPRSAVTVADKIKSQMSFAPRALMPGKPENSTLLTFAQILKWHKEAGVQLSQTLESALTTASTGGWSVSPKTLAKIKKGIFAQLTTKTGKPINFLKLAGGESGMDKRLKNFVTIPRDILPANTADEMAPFLQELNDRIETFTKSGVDQTVATMNDLQVMAEDSTSLGVSGRPLRDFSRGLLVPVKDMQTGVEDNFIAIERTARRLKLSQADYLSGLEDVIPQIITESSIVPNLHGPLTVAGDEYLQALRKAAVGTHRIEETLNEKGEKIQRLVRVEGAKSKDAINNEILRAADIAAMKADAAGVDIEKTVVRRKGKRWDESLVASLEKEDPELQSILGGLKKNIDNATSPKEKLAAFQELDQFLFQQERYAIASRIKLTEDARRSGQSGDIRQIKRTISDLKKQKAAALRKITEDSKSAIANGTQFVQPPVDLSDLDARYAGVNEFEQELNQEMLAKRQALQIAHQAELDSANKILTEEMEAASTPSAKQKLEKQGLAKIASLKEMHADELYWIEREIEDNRRIISSARSRLDASPASFDSQIHDAETKLKEISPSNQLSDAEKTLIKERKELNRKIKKAGYIPPNRPTADILTLQDRLAAMNAPVDTSGVIFEEELSRAERVAERNAAAMASERARGSAKAIGETPGRIDMMGRSVVPPYSPYTPVYPKPIVKPVVPPYSPYSPAYPQTTSRFLGPKFDQARIPKAPTDFYGRPFRLKDYPIRTSFATPTAPAIPDAKQSILGRIKGLFGRNKSAGISDAGHLDLGGLFRTPKSVGAAAVPMRGVDIVEKFTEGLRKELGEVLTKSGHDIDKLMSAMNTIARHPKTGHKAAADATRAFFDHIVTLPDDVVNQVMQARIKDIAATFRSQTAAGMAGPRSKTGTQRSLRSFIERLRKNLGGVQGQDGKTVIEGVYEKFFGKRKNPELDPTTAKGLDNNLKDIFVDGMKSNYVGLASGEEARSSVTTKLREAGRALQPGQEKQRDTRDGVKASKKRFAARTGRVKNAITQAVGDVNQELTDLRTQLANKVQGLLDQKNIVVPDVAAQMVASIVDPIDEFHQDITSSLDEGVKVVTGGVKDIDVPNLDGMKETLVAPIVQAQQGIVDGVEDAMTGQQWLELNDVNKVGNIPIFDPSTLNPANIVEAVTVKPVGKNAGKPITKKAQKALDRAAKELATAFKEIDSSTIRAGEILKTTDLKKIKLNAPLKIKQISESVVMAEKEYAEAFAAAQIAHPSKGSTGINNLSGVAAKKNRLELFKKELKDLEKYINQSLLIEQETARLLSETAKAPKVIPANKTTGAGKPTLPPPKDEEKKPPRIVRKRRSRGIPIGDDGGDGKAFNIDKIGHRFQGPNIFSKNIFDANLKDIIPNFDDLMAANAKGAAVLGTAGQTAGAAIDEGAAAMVAASATIKQSVISQKLFGNKALKGKFAEGAERSVIEELFGSKMAKKNIIPKYVTEKLEDGTEKTLLSSATRKRSLLPFGRIPIGLPIKQDLADVDRLLTKGVLPNFTRLKKLLTGALGKTWLFALSGGLSVLIGPLTKVLKNFGGLKQVFAGTATIFAQSGSMLKGVAAAAGQVTSNVFGGIQKAATVGLNIFAKIAGAVLMIGTAFLIIVPVIGILIALYGMFKSANGRLAGAATALKEAFKALVDGAKALFAPVRDLIFVFTGADKQMGGLTSEGQKNAAFFTIIANAIKKATTAFKEWAETIGAAFVKNTVVPQITRIINKFILLGSAIKDFSSGDKASGMAKLKAMMLSFAYDIVGILKIITVGLINAFAYAAPVIIQVMQGLLQLLGEMIWAYMQEIGKSISEGTTNGILKGVINTSPLLRGVLKLDDLFGVSDGAVTFAQSYGEKSQKEKALEGVDPGQRKYVDLAPGDPPTEAEKNVKKWDAKLRDLIKSAGVGVGGAYDKVLAMLDSRYAEVLSATNIKVNGINVPIVIDKKAGKGVIDQIAYIVKESADAATAGGESLMDQINNGMKSKVAEIKDTLKGSFYSNVDEKFDDIVSQYTDALEKQKDQQLKAYDDQITAIDELAAAEERLTDTKDYESRKREIIDKRQYDHENYSVERKLAVYEGRTFDVRRLDREEVASKTESDKSLTDLDSERLKTLQSFQRDLVKGVIANQKDIAEKEFDVILKSFDTFMKGVKNKSFSTQEEFAAALKGVADRALSSSLELGHAFEDGLAKLPAAIAAVRTPSIALFSTAMGDLITEANTAFGVATGSANPASLLGAVGLLVAGSQAGFAAAFSTTFAPLYVKPAVDAITVITGSLSKPGDPNNIAESWKKAGKDAFEALEAELNRTIAWEKIFKSFDDLFEGLKPKIKKVVDLAVAAQNALANVGGQTAAPTTILDEATMKDFQATTLTAAKKYGAGKAYIPPAQLGIMATRVTEFIGAHISEGSVGILASAARADSGLSATEIAILKLALPALNIASGALALTANPNAYANRTDSNGRTGFMYGGQVGRYGIGGYLKAPASQGIPALLHGGEYIINHKAVEKFGKGNLERINNLKNGGDFRGFASGGYMTVPGFANGGYMTTPGFARGGAVRRNVGNKPKGTDSNQTNNGMRLFTNSNGQSYYVPDTNVRSGANSGMILHPLDWQAIAVSENGQDWEKKLGKVSKTDKGVFVGALNIARANWMRFGQGKFGNFNDPLNPPSFENQIKVAEIMYKGLASDPSAWGRAPKYLDGFEGVRLGRVDFPKLSELKTYNRLKAQGLALGGSVRKRIDPVIPDRFVDQIRIKGNPSSRIQIPKEINPNGKRVSTYPTPWYDPRKPFGSGYMPNEYDPNKPFGGEKRYPQDGSYQVDAPWAGYTNKPELPQTWNDRGRPDYIPTPRRLVEGFPVWYRHILGYYLMNDIIPKGGKKGSDVSIEWNGKNRWTRPGLTDKRYLGGMIPKFKLGGLVKPGFKFPNPLDWLFGKDKKKDKNQNTVQNQTMWTDKVFDITKDPWKAYLKHKQENNQYGTKTDKELKEEVYANYLESLEMYGSQIMTLPPPQWIKNMPLQLAMENDDVNIAKTPAVGGVIQSTFANNGLIMRGIKKIFVSPQYLDEDNLFRDDGDAIWRKTANESALDSRITNHLGLMETHRGVKASMDAMSKYLNIPYEFTKARQFTTVPSSTDLKKSLVIDVFGDYAPGANWAGQTTSRITPPGGAKSKDNTMEVMIRKNANYSKIWLNTSLTDVMPGGTNYPYYDFNRWANVFNHEFGHVAGGFDHPHDYIRGLVDKYKKPKLEYPVMENSIMSYDTLSGTEGNVLRPSDINAYRDVMGFNQLAPTIIKRLDSEIPGSDSSYWKTYKNIFNNQKPAPYDGGKGSSGIMLSPIADKNNKKQFPKVKKFGFGGFLDKLKFGIGGKGPGGPWGGMVTGMRDAIVGGATKGLRFVDDIATGGTFTHMFRAIGADVKGDSKTANIEGLKGLASFGAMLVAPKIIGAALKPVSKFVVKPLAKFAKTGITNALARESAALAGNPSATGLGDNYLSTFIKEIFGGKTHYGMTQGIGDPATGLMGNVLRADNIAIREAKRLANLASVSAGDGRGPFKPGSFQSRGPITKIADFMSNLNPFQERIGIHVGRPGSSAILPNQVTSGPGDAIKGFVYSWLKGSEKNIADEASFFARSQGMLDPSLTRLGQEGLDTNPGSYYITRAMGAILRDANIANSPARLSPLAQVLEELPITSTKEELAEALGKYRGGGGIKGFFNSIKSRFGKEIYLHSSPTQGLSEIKPFSGAAIGNKDPYAFLKAATMEPGMTEASWKYTGTNSGAAASGWGKIRGMMPSAAPGGSVYVVKGPRNLPLSSSIFDDVDPNSFLSKKALKVISEIKVPAAPTKELAFGIVDTSVREAVTNIRNRNNSKIPRFKKGGYLNFKEGGEVPSILHGGEYVLNAGAVKKYGIAHIEAMNKMRFNVPQPGFSVPQSSFSGSLAGGMSTSTQNVNIYVDNFIGEPEWFNSMMKDYNTTVLPRNQKAAGLESRVISTYSGLNRGN